MNSIFMKVIMMQPMKLTIKNSLSKTLSGILRCKNAPIKADSKKIKNTIDNLAKLIGLAGGSFRSVSFFQNN